MKMRCCGADLEHGENAGRIYRPIGVYAKKCSVLFSVRRDGDQGLQNAIFRP